MKGKITDLIALLKAAVLLCFLIILLLNGAFYIKENYHIFASLYESISEHHKYSETCDQRYNDLKKLYDRKAKLLANMEREKSNAIYEKANIVDSYEQKVNLYVNFGNFYIDIDGQVQEVDKCVAFAHMYFYKSKEGDFADAKRYFDYLNCKESLIPEDYFNQAMACGDKLINYIKRTKEMLGSLFRKGKVDEMKQILDARKDLLDEVCLFVCYNKDSNETYWNDHKRKWEIFSSYLSNLCNPEKRDLQP